MANRMVELAEQQPGFLGMESVRDGVGLPFLLAPDAIKSWKQHVEHLNAQQLGRDKWYNAFTTRIAKVELNTRCRIAVTIRTHHTLSLLITLSAIMGKYNN